MIEIELGGISEKAPCPDCGSLGKTVWGFVKRAGSAYAVYYAAWTPGHPERGAQLILSIDGWGEGADATLKRCVAIESFMGEDRPAFTVIDAHRSLWADMDFLGKKLTRQEAFETGITKEALDILDHLTYADTRFKDFMLTGK